MRKDEGAVCGCPANFPPFSLPSSTWVHGFDSSQKKNDADIENKRVSEIDIENKEVISIDIENKEFIPVRGFVSRACD